MGKLDLLGEFLLNWRIKVVLPYIHGRLMDIGCGTNKLVKQYGNGIGVDVYQFGGADLILKDTSKIPYDNESFDTITIIASLNHIPNREEVLKEIHRILKRDGRLIITMISPRISKFWHLIRSPWDKDQKERGMNEGEVYGMTKKNIINLIEQCGFIIKKELRFMLFINRLTLAGKI
ncbi:MAG: methyltransferase domain-containing protein [Spirochaetota bacterium]|nr:methyltransferase domain-containing protein [Spirochaetota bacterium]